MSGLAESERKLIRLSQLEGFKHSKVGEEFKGRVKTTLKFAL